MVEEYRDECGSMYNEYGYEMGSANVVSSTITVPGTTEEQKLANKLAVSQMSLESAEVDEEYDKFDGDAVHLGDVNLSQLLATASTVAGQTRRVTSVRLLSATKDLSSKPPKKVGYLHKYSPALLAGWQQRWVEINDGIFKYFKEVKGQKQNQGTLNFDLYRCNIILDPKKLSQFKITFNGNQREFWFKASSDQDAKAWIDVINTHIRQSKGFIEDALAPKTKEFWKQE